MKGFRSYPGPVAAGAVALMAACGAAEPPRLAESTTQAEPHRTLESFILVPGVVADPGRGLVYVMRPAGGIEALDLADGGVRWASDRADQPLLVAHGVLVALAESPVPGLALALLDPESGEPAAEAAEPLVLSLPSGVVAGIDQALDRSFEHSVLESGGGIYLTWEFIERHVTGVAPPGGRVFARRETGAFRFLGRAFATSPPPMPTPGVWPAEVQELLDSRQVPRPPWRTGTVLAVAQQRYDPDELVLKRWRQRDGEPLEEGVLSAGRAIAVLGSCDERHVVVAMGSGRSAPDPSYLLRIHSLSTGDLVAHVPSERSAGPFCLLGSRLLRLSLPEVRRVGDRLVVSPLALVASDVGSGAEVWRRVVRDTAFRDPAPPRS